MPCNFGLLPHPRSGTRAQSNGLLGVTVVVRWIPLVPAASGTRVVRPARTTMLRRGGDGSQLYRRVRPVPGDHCIVGKSPAGLAAARWGDSNSGRLPTGPLGPLCWRPDLRLCPP